MPQQLQPILQYGLQHTHTVLQAVQEHLYLVVIPILIGIAMGFPLGIGAVRWPGWGGVVLNMVNTLRVIPSIAVLFLTIPLWGLSDRTALFALTILVCPPILLNTHAGFQSVDPAMLEVAQGLGMSAWQQFWRVEFPLAFPLVRAGIKTAVLEAIASATLAAFIGGGGLGQFIVLGFATYDFNILLVGAIPIAGLAILAEIILGQGNDRS
ncbi:MAG: ABC transporter permease [Prochlorotrichaceae cyanobacterium]|jgi:osmoprotectant transport system permease protein